ATRIGGPDGTRLWLQGDSFGVRHAVAELGGFASVDLRVAVERLNGKLGAAHLFDCLLVLLAPFLHSSVTRPLLDDAGLIATGIHDPAYVAGDDDKNRCGIHKGILPDGLFCRWRVHGWLLRSGGCIHGAADFTPGN